MREKVKNNPKRPLRHLVCVLGDQLDRNASAFDGFDQSQDAVWMAEVREEAEHVWSSKSRIVMFLSAMRHFAASLSTEGIPLYYRKIDDPKNRQGFVDELALCLQHASPQKLIITEPGEYRVKKAFTDICKRLDVPLDTRPDRSFFCSHEEFEEHASRHKQLRMEYFYRDMRRRHRVLMDAEKPLGGKWNFDARNRQVFSKKGPEISSPAVSFPPDEITREVSTLVKQRFQSHPGSLDDFNWPVTPEQAQAALRDFVQSRLKFFGPYQDAMWTDYPFLYHSGLSAAMNLKLLDPREVIRQAEAAFTNHLVPINSAEGFIRQVLGWREFIRGVYWRYMPGYPDMNALGAESDLPKWYWTGDTDAYCLQEVIRQTLRYGYAHHIQRLMVTGLFALLLGVRPREVHRWYLAVYVDAVEWVELPNTLGMSQFADGGILASKPYAATGKYINRMSNYCENCPYDPNRVTGEHACPFTTLYWHFLIRHARMLSKNPRMALQVRNLERLDKQRIKEINRQAKRVTTGFVS
jgi:deoxyribodipyrimidine photolyase-related protein